MNGPSTLTKNEYYRLCREHDDRLLPIFISLGVLKLKDPKGKKVFSNVTWSEQILTQAPKRILKDGEIQAIRTLWPPGKRSSAQEMAEKLTNFMVAHQQYTFEQIMECARKYLASVDNPMYIMKSGYFISKKPPGEPAQSRLLDELEALEDNQNVIDDEFI